MSKIISLDNSTVSKIAAGEIIERPASVIKELLENSIDAKATQVVVEVRDSCDRYLRVTDNGEGMDEEDLYLAFKRHATSKIRSIEDLNDLNTLGFRGEALPSIAHVGFVEVISRTEEMNHGIKLTIEYGTIVHKEMVGAPVGTTFIIRDLFKNLPVRKKFLKKDSVEYRHVSEVVEKIALGSFDTSVTLIKDFKTMFQSSPNLDPLNHIYTILGKDVATNLLPISFQSSSYTIRGYVSSNLLFRSTRNQEYLYINGRYVRNLEISKAVERKYRSKIPLNKYPVYILFIEIDPILVDVNIHPKKHEVKLSNQNQLIPILEQLIDEVFPEVVKSHYWEGNREREEEKTIFQQFSVLNEETVPLSYPEEKRREEKLDQNFPLFKDNREEKDFSQKNSNGTKLMARETAEEFNDVEERGPLRDLSKSRYIGQLFKTYLLFEEFTKEEFLLLDQHAAHERILFEKYWESYQREEVDRQILLTPEILRFSSKELAVIEEHWEKLKKMGFTLEPFGERDYLLREIPYIFGVPLPLRVFHDILDSLGEIKSVYDQDIYSIMRRACRSAIKGGDPLEDMEVKSLLSSLAQCHDPHTCPHGRPVLVRITKRDLEKMFLRVES